MNYEVLYADNDDRVDYPIKPHHKAALDKITEVLNIAPGEVWMYHATIHGVVLMSSFSVEFLNNTAGGRTRLDREVLEALLSLKGFRWVETNEGNLSIALTHYEDEIVK